MFNVIACAIILLSAKGESLNTKEFPEDFIFGVSSSSLQVEGAWNVDGKGESIWEHFALHHADKVDGKTNIEASCDAYYKTVEDVRLLKDLGVDFYRFSIDWTRILPAGFPNKINQAGVDYYHGLIDELMKNGITPMVTIFHWELPQRLSDLGGFANGEIVSWIEDYARILFATFGEKVKFWISLNEPRIMCEYGYGNGEFAPGLEFSGIGDYLCEHNVLRSHARIYRLYQKEFKPTQRGQVGLAVDAQWYEPATDSAEDIEAADRVRQFQYGKYLHPIFTAKGDYPDVLKKRVAEASKLQGFSKSRLPKFSPDEVESLKNSSDFLALNHYTTALVRDAKEEVSKIPSLENDFKAEMFFDPSWESTAMPHFKVVPWGFRKMLKYIRDEYSAVDIYITEIGFAAVHSVNDPERANYHQQMLSSVLDSIHTDEVPIKGYLVWSFLDSYEWASSYKFGFGLYYVNFTDPNRNRIAKDSAKYYSKVIKERRLVFKDEL